LAIGVREIAGRSPSAPLWHTEYVPRIRFTSGTVYLRRHLPPAGGYPRIDDPLDEPGLRQVAYALADAPSVWSLAFEGRTAPGVRVYAEFPVVDGGLGEATRFRVDHLRGASARGVRDRKISPEWLRQQLASVLNPPREDETAEQQAARAAVRGLLRSVPTQSLEDPEAPGSTPIPMSWGSEGGRPGTRRGEPKRSPLELARFAEQWDERIEAGDRKPRVTLAERLHFSVQQISNLREQCCDERLLTRSDGPGIASGRMTHKTRLILAQAPAGGHEAPR